jgi:antitoxin ChpS
LKAGASVGLAVDEGRLIVEVAPKQRFTMTELLAASDYSTPVSKEDLEWRDAPPVGKELL